jgi:predicted phosphodiesterase
VPAENTMERLALVADTHNYRAGLPILLDFFRRQGLKHLACLGDCPPEPFRPWLEFDSDNRLYWVFDFYGPELPAATGNDMALEVAGRVFLAHTRALVWTHFKDRINAYEHGPRSCRPPLLLCHGHTHVPRVTRFTPPFSRILYSNDALRPQDFRGRQVCLPLEPDTIYLIVPGAFTLEEGRYPAFSFAVLDLTTSRLAMVSLTDLASLETLELFPEK